MSENLIGLEDIEKIFRILNTDNDVAHIKLHRGKFIIHVKIPFSFNERLASLLGHTLGDGCIKSKEESFNFVNKNKDLINEVKLTIKELFGLEIEEKFNEKREFFELRSPKVIAKFLVLCRFPKGKKTKQIIKLPEWIKNGSKEIKSAFLRALFDDEGTVINSKGNRMISFGLNKEISLLDSHKQFIEEIREMLSSLGVFSNEIFERKQTKNTKQLGFHITGKFNLIKFLENIGFTHKGKREKLVKTINSFKIRSKHETKMMILNALKTKGPLGTKDLVLIVDRDRSSVWKNLNRLKKEGLVRKIVINRKGPIEKVLWGLKTNINSNIEQ